MAARLIHEADHGRVGRHNCGNYADQDENSPYGTEIQYLVQTAAAQPVGSVDRARYWDRGVGRLTGIALPPSLGPSPVRLPVPVCGITSLFPLPCLRRATRSSNQPLRS